MNKLDWSHAPLIMGIVNVTPDSFSGDGLMVRTDFIDTALGQAGAMLEEGAAILDIGGESSRPGAISVGAEEEIRRVVPVVEAIRTTHGEKPIIAIDTIKAAVAEAALKAGADMINDITALADPRMGETVARYDCPVIMMHNRSAAQNVSKDARLGGEYQAPHYDDVVEDVKRDLMHAVAVARQAGIADGNIILDPGLGFGKNVTQNLALVKHMAAIKALGFPVLSGPSRKSFIGKTLDLPVDERMEGTAALVALSAFLGADIIRVHDVQFMARVAKMAASVRHA